jgi:hypothetical protein
MQTIRPEVTGRASGDPTDPQDEQQKKKRKPRSGTLAMSIAQFCDRHGISEALYHKLPKNEKPDTMEVGNRVLISEEAAKRWRKKRERAAANRLTAPKDTARSTAGAEA